MTGWGFGHRPGSHCGPGSALLMLMSPQVICFIFQERTWVQGGPAADPTASGRVGVTPRLWGFLILGL